MSSVTTPLSATPRTKLGRNRERAAHDRAVLDEILREGMFCHLGVVVDGSPLVLPTTYAVDLGPDAPDAPHGTLYFHGSVAARNLVAAGRQQVCITVTHVDGLVLARSGFHHSANYRSAVIFGEPRVLADDEKRHALDLLVDHLVPGRSGTLREPTRKDLAATVVLALPLTEASVKTREGGVEDEPEDVDLPIWAGVLPLRTVAGGVESAEDCTLPVPEHVQARAEQLGTR